MMNKLATLSHVVTLLSGFLLLPALVLQAEENLEQVPAATPSPQIPAKPHNSKKKASLSLKKSSSLAENERGVKAVLQRNWVEAEAAFKRALLNDPNNIAAAFNLAGVYITTRNNEKAIALLEDYTTRYPNDAGLYIRLGDAYFSRKRVDDALRVYEKGFSIAPGYNDLSMKLATLYGLKKDFKTAEKMLEIAASQKPNDTQVLNNLGNVYILNGKADMAVNVAKQALQTKTCKESYLTLATAYEAQFDYKNAIIAYKKAIDLGEKRVEISDKLEKLRKMAS